MMSVFGFLSTIIGLTVLIGFVIYIVFYEFFQRLIAVKIPAVRDDVSEKPVMCGFVADEIDSPPVTKIVKEILYRAWRQGAKFVERSVSSYLSDWYFVSIVLLLMLVLLAFIMGW